MTILSAILLILVLLFWLGLVAVLMTMNDGDAAGRGMGYFFALVLTIALWLLLATLMLIAVKKGDVGSAKRAVLILVPFSFAAAVGTIYALSNDVVPPSRLPIVVPAATSLLIIGYFLWATLPSLHAAIPAAMMNRVIWGLVLVLSLVPWPLLMAKNRRVAAAQAEYVAAEKASEDSAAEALEAELQSLTSETPLRDWLAFATAGNDFRERTLQGIRALPRRQSDAEAMRGADQAMLMDELRNLGLDASPALFRSAKEFLIDHAESFRDRAAPTTRYEVEAQSIERYFLSMQWLATNQCDLVSAVNTYDRVVRLFPAAPDREQFLARLAQL